MFDDSSLLLASQAWKRFLVLYHSSFFFWVKIVLAIYVAVLIVDIILIIALHTPQMYFRVLKAGANVPAPFKGKMQRRWQKITDRLGEKNVSQYKVAILEADKVADEILEQLGYQGNNMGERLANIRPEQLEMVDELKEAHEVRNEIVYKEDFVLDRVRAEEIMKTYQKLLETLEFI